MGIISIFPPRPRIAPWNHQHISLNQIKSTNPQTKSQIWSSPNQSPRKNMHKRRIPHKLASQPDLQRTNMQAGSSFVCDMLLVIAFWTQSMLFEVSSWTLQKIYSQDEFIDGEHGINERHFERLVKNIGWEIFFIWQLSEISLNKYQSRNQRHSL